MLLGLLASSLPTRESVDASPGAASRSRPSGALRAASDALRLRHVVGIRIKQSMQDDGGQPRSVTELHGDMVEFLDGRHEMREA